MGYRDVPFAVASPVPGMLATLARETFRKPSTARPGLRYRRGEIHVLEGLLDLVGSGAGNDELLSYLLFDRDFANEQIKAGVKDADKCLSQLQWA